MVTRKPATRDDWDIHPMPDDAAVPLDWQRRFSAEEYRLLQLGYIPNAGSDMLFAFFEDETFFTHWASSGQCHFTFRIAVDGEEYQLVDPMINRNPTSRTLSVSDRMISLLDEMLNHLLFWIKRTEKPAIRADWQTVSMPDKKTRLDVNIVVTETRYEKLRWGFVPRAMEDHWFYFMEDDWLHLHRSWTGYCVYQIKFEPDDSGYKAVEIWANRDPDQYFNLDHYHRADEYDRDWLLGFFRP